MRPEMLTRITASYSSLRNYFHAADRFEMEVQRLAISRAHQSKNNGEMMHLSQPPMPRNNSDPSKVGAESSMPAVKLEQDGDSPAKDAADLGENNSEQQPMDRPAAEEDVGSNGSTSKKATPPADDATSAFQQSQASEPAQSTVPPLAPPTYPAHAPPLTASRPIPTAGILAAHPGFNQEQFMRQQQQLGAGSPNASHSGLVQSTEGMMASLQQQPQASSTNPSGSSAAQMQLHAQLVSVSNHIKQLQEEMQRMQGFFTNPNFSVQPLQQQQVAQHRFHDLQVQYGKITQYARGLAQQQQQLQQQQQQASAPIQLQQPLPHSRNPSFNGSQQAGSPPASFVHPGLAQPDAFNAGSPPSNAPTPQSQPRGAGSPASQHAPQPKKAAARKPKKDGKAKSPGPGTGTASANMTPEQLAMQRQVSSDRIALRSAQLTGIAQQQLAEVFMQQQRSTPAYQQQPQSQQSVPLRSDSAQGFASTFANTQQLQQQMANVYSGMNATQQQMNQPVASGSGSNGIVENDANGNRGEPDPDWDAFLN